MSAILCDSFLPENCYLALSISSEDALGATLAFALFGKVAVVAADELPAVVYSRAFFCCSREARCLSSLSYLIDWRIFFF